MTWWLIPSIIGVIIAGIAFGILISFIILKLHKKNFPSVFAPKASPSGGNGFESVSEIDGIYRIPLTTPSIAENNVSITRASPNRPQAVYPAKTVGQVPATASTPGIASILSELENNLAIASRPESAQLINFQTDMWNTRRADFNTLEPDIMKELTEAYVDMLLANNIVWLVTELKRDSKDLANSYFRLSAKVAERLTRILPAVRRSQE